MEPWKATKPNWKGPLSLIMGLLSFIPFFGILAGILGVMWGKQQRKIEKVMGTKLAVVFSYLGLIFNVIFIIFTIWGFAIIASQTSGAAATDSKGIVKFNILGQATSFKFMDPSTNTPIEGLSVGYALDPNKTQGVMFVIDPSGYYPVKMAILRGGQKTLSQGITAGAITDINPITYFMDYQPTSTMGKIFLDKLPKGVDTVLGLTDAAVMAAKVLDQSGLPLGEYAGKFESAEITYLTKEEAWAGIQSDMKSKLNENLAFFIQPEFLATKGAAIPNLEGTLMNTLSFAADANAVFFCGLPGEKIKITTFWQFKFYECTNHNPMEEQVAGLFKAEFNGLDERGLPLSPGDSYNLVSTDNIGMGFNIPIANGQASQLLPPGNYLGDNPQTNPSQIEVGEQGANVNVDVNPQTFPSEEQEIEDIGGYVEEDYGANEIQFSVNDLVDYLAVINSPYNYSFCYPYVTGPSEICDTGEDYTYPSDGYNAAPYGGNSPYHFQLDSGSGFLPMGLILHPNGYVDGTPSVAGTYSFKICAVDQSAKQNCQDTSIEVADAAVTFDSVTCTSSDPDLFIEGTGKIMKFKITAKGTARGPIRSSVGYEPDYNKYMEADPAASMYIPGGSDECNCGGWTDSNTVIPSCTNNIGDGSLTSFTIVYTLNTNTYPLEMNEIVMLYVKGTPYYPAYIKITRPVTCS